MKRFFLLLVFIGGCSLTPAKPPAQEVLFDLTGRISVKYDGKGLYGNFEWAHQQGSDDIRIFSPLGQTLAAIYRDEKGARLVTSSQEKHEAKDLEILMQEVMGWHLPMKGLDHWVKAVASPESPAEKEFDPDGRLSTLRQDDWLIRYKYESKTTPREITMQYGDLEIRLLIDE